MFDGGHYLKVAERVCKQAGRESLSPIANFPLSKMADLTDFRSSPRQEIWDGNGDFVAMRVVPPEFLCGTPWGRREVETLPTRSGSPRLRDG